MRDIDKIVSRWGDDMPVTQRRKSDSENSSLKNPVVVSKEIIIKSIPKKNVFKTPKKA